MLVGGVVIVVVVAAVVAAVVLLAKKKEQNRIEPVPGPIAENGETDFLDSFSGGGDTAVLVQSDSQFTLILSDLDHPERHYEIPLHGKVTIGRSQNNLVVLDYDKSVSGAHCEIYVENGEFKLRDVGSRNGTFIDGIRVMGVTEIANGSTIKLGRLCFRVEIR